MRCSQFQTPSHVVAVVIAVFTCFGADANAQNNETLTGCASDSPSFIHFNRAKPESGFSYELFHRPSWARGPQLHYWFGKDTQAGKDLQAKADTAISAIESLGDIKKLALKYFPTDRNGAHRPLKPSGNSR